MANNDFETKDTLAKVEALDKTLGGKIAFYLISIAALLATEVLGKMEAEGYGKEKN